VSEYFVAPADDLSDQVHLDELADKLRACANTREVIRVRDEYLGSKTPLKRKRAIDYARDLCWERSHTLFPPPAIGTPGKAAADAALANREQLAREQEPRS